MKKRTGCLAAVGLGSLVSVSAAAGLPILASGVVGSSSQNAIVCTFGQLGSMTDETPSILGPSTVTYVELTNWWTAKGHGEPSELAVPIDDLIARYLDEGDHEGVRGDIAFAQAIHETGWFTSADTAINNFAGIAHTPGAGTGQAFPDPATGVRAHIQLLKKFAAGNDVHLTHPEVAPDAAGTALTWGQLAGTWASDDNYWAAISRIYNSMPGSPGREVSPIVRGLLEGYAKLHGTDVDAKTPLRADGLRRIAETLSQPAPTSARDLAICLLATHPALNLGASALAGLDGGHVQLPDGYDEPMVLLVGRQGSRALHPIQVPPEQDTSICPVGAMRALATDPFGPVFRSAPDRRLTRQGICWLIDTAITAVGLTPLAVVAGFPKLNTNDRAKLAAHLAHAAPFDIRDRAIITNLYWGCFRGSELAAMRWCHVAVVDAGIEWHVPKAKNDQHGTGNTVGVPRHPNPWLCPVLALDDWHTTHETLTGRPIGPDDHVFPTLDRRTRLTGALHRDAINDIVRRAAQRAGLVGDYGSHSPRAGFTTDCIDADIPREHVQHHGRWTNIRSLDPYYRKTSTWGRTNPATRLAQHDD